MYLFEIQVLYMEEFILKNTASSVIKQKGIPKTPMRAENVPVWAETQNQ